MTSIRLHKLNKQYQNGVEAVRDVSLSVAPSEFLVLVGPSGCGKSTLLRMIAGLETISSGDLYFDDRLMNETEARDRDIGMVFQNYALYPHLTVFENIAFPLQVRKQSKTEIAARVDDVSRMLSIHHLLSRLPKQLSGGQRQRVALGRAIARKPRVFLFDEPLSNLDANLRVEMRAELTLLQRKVGTTSVYVTHDHIEAMTMGDRIVVLRDGSVMQVGTPHELYTNPQSEFVARFLGSPSINVFEGTVVHENGLHFKETGSDISIALDPSHCYHSSSTISNAVRCAFRAEDVHCVQEKPTFHAPIENLEFIGHETLVQFRSVRGLMNARIHTDSALERGTLMGFRIDTPKILLFDHNGDRL